MENPLKQGLLHIRCSTINKLFPFRVNGKTMVEFIRKFTVNARLPAFCEIEKGVSRGMGTIAFAGRSFK